MAVYIPIPINTVETAPEPPSRTYAIDFNKGRILGKIDGLEAVSQAIRKALITPRFKCLIYDNQYGSEIKDVIISGNAAPTLIETIIPAFVEDALAPDTRILKVYDFTFDISDEQVYVTFKVNTIYGEMIFKEVF